MAYLSKRLLKVAEEIGDATTFADVGCDHGKLIVYILKRNVESQAFAIDISEASLRKAKIETQRAGVDERVKFFCFDGIRDLKEEPEVIVIAGMGGHEIASILSAKTFPQTKFVFVPHQDAAVLRLFLRENGFAILKDYVITDGKYYTVMVAVKGDNHYTASEIILGKNNPPTLEFDERLIHRKQYIENLIEKAGSVDALQTEIQWEYREVCQWLLSKKSLK